MYISLDLQKLFLTFKIRNNQKFYYKKYNQKNYKKYLFKKNSDNNYLECEHASDSFLTKTQKMFTHYPYFMPFLFYFMLQSCNIHNSKESIFYKMQQFFASNTFSTKCALYRTAHAQIFHNLLWLTEYLPGCMLLHKKYYLENKVDKVPSV